MNTNSDTKKLLTRTSKKKTLPQTIGKTAAVKSVFRTAQILQCLAKDVNSIKDIAGGCNLSTTTVHRILQSLEESELAFQDPTNEQYYLGPLFLQLKVTQINSHRILSDRSYEELIRLSRLFGESIALDVEIGLQIVNLLHIPSKFNFGVISPERLMFYSSVSRAMLSQHSEEEIDLILSYLILSRSNRIVDKENLKQQILECKLRGYNVYQRAEEGVTGISALIRNYICPTTISVVGPEIRLGPIADEVVKELKTSAERIAQNLAKSRRMK